MNEPAGDIDAMSSIVSVIFLPSSKVEDEKQAWLEALFNASKEVSSKTLFLFTWLPSTGYFSQSWWHLVSQDQSQGALQVC